MFHECRSVCYNQDRTRAIGDREDVTEEKKTDLLTRQFVKIRERFVRFCRAQKIFEHALILVAIRGSRLQYLQILGQQHWAASPAASILL